MGCETAVSRIHERIRFATLTAAVGATTRAAIGSVSVGRTRNWCQPRRERAIIGAGGRVLPQDEVPHRVIERLAARGQHLLHEFVVGGSIHACRKVREDEHGALVVVAAGDKGGAPKKGSGRQKVGRRGRGGQQGALVDEGEQEGVDDEAGDEMMELLRL